MPSNGNTGLLDAYFSVSFHYSGREVDLFIELCRDYRKSCRGGKGRRHVIREDVGEIQKMEGGSSNRRILKAW